MELFKFIIAPANADEISTHYSWIVMLLLTTQEMSKVLLSFLFGRNRLRARGLLYPGHRLRLWCDRPDNRLRISSWRSRR